MNNKKYMGLMESSLKTATKMSRVIKAVLENPGLRQNAIVKLTGYPRVDVHRLCRSAELEGWIKNVGSSGYVPGDYVIDYMRGGI